MATDGAGSADAGPRAPRDPHLATLREHEDALEAYLLELLRNGVAEPAQLAALLIGYAAGFLRFGTGLDPTVALLTIDGLAASILSRIERAPTPARRPSIVTLAPKGRA